MQTLDEVYCATCKPRSQGTNRAGWFTYTVYEKLSYVEKQHNMSRKQL